MLDPTDVPQYKEPSLSFEECKSMLCKNGESYSNEEVEAIRILILNLVQIEYMSYVRKKCEDKGKIVKLNEDNDYQKAS